MSAAQVIDLADGAAWPGWRQRDVTGSRIGALFDAHPFVARERLATQMRGGGKAFDNPHMRAGRLLEPSVVVAIRERFPTWRIERCGKYFRSAEHRVGATPDYWLDDDGLIECTTTTPDEWRRFGEKPPLYKCLQLAVQQFVTNRPRGYVAVMVKVLPELPLHLFEQSRNPEVERQILDAVAEWWAAFDRGESPPAASATGLADLLGAAGRNKLVQVAPVSAKARKPQMRVVMDGHRILGFEMVDA